MEKDEADVRALVSRSRNGDRVAKIRLDLGTEMDRHCGVFRDESGMSAAQAKIPELKERYARVGLDDKGRVFNTDLVFALELGFMLDCAETILASALERKESRGAQARRDYPKRDDANWLKHILVTRSDSGPRLSHLPVVITRWKPEERKY